MRFLLPTPGAILDALAEHREVLARAAWNTSKGALLGFGVAIVVSFVLALALSLSPLLPPPTSLSLVSPPLPHPLFFFLVGGPGPPRGRSPLFFFSSAPEKEGNGVWGAREE